MVDVVRFAARVATVLSTTITSTLLRTSRDQLRYHEGGRRSARPSAQRSSTPHCGPLIQPARVIPRGMRAPPGSQGGGRRCQDDEARRATLLRFRRGAGATNDPIEAATPARANRKPRRITDHLVGAQQQILRHLDVPIACDTQVDDELVPD